MTRRRRIGWGAAFAIALLIASGFPLRAGAQARGVPESFADLTEKLLPAVVNISTTQTIKPAQSSGATPGRQGRATPDTPAVPPGSPFDDFFHDFFDRQQQQGNRGGDTNPAPRKATSLGSGFIIDASGLVVTNNHVIADADEITVILQDNTSIKAELVGRDTKTDLALLRIKTDHKLQAVQFGDSNKTRVGDWVIAIGNPFGFGGSVTAGIISARSRELSNGPYDDFLQTDASINKGNSGGPLFNMDGDVIGVITAIISPGGSIGIGFAIPSELASNITGQLKDFGKTRRGWIGVKIQNVNDEIAESLGLDKPKGAMVAAVNDGGPAQQGGIQPGDVITIFDGKDVANTHQLPRIVAETPIDKTVKVTIWRKRQPMSVDVKVAELKDDDQTQANATPTAPPKPAAPPPASVKALGLALSPVTPELKEKFSLADDTSGAVITEIAKDSPAIDKGVKVGDVIVEVAQEEVKTPQQVATKIEDARKSGRKSVLMLVDRQGDLRFIAVRIDQS